MFCHTAFFLLFCYEGYHFNYKNYIIQINIILEVNVFIDCICIVNIANTAIQSFVSFFCNLLIFFDM